MSTDWCEAYNKLEQELFACQEYSEGAAEALMFMTEQRDMAVAALKAYPELDEDCYPVAVLRWYHGQRQAAIAAVEGE